MILMNEDKGNCMHSRKRMIASVCWIVIGAALMGAHDVGWTDEYWNGMGTSLLVVGVLQMIRHIRYRTDEAYKAHVDVETKDERNKFIAGKAWAWAGYLFVLIGAAASLLCKIAGNDQMTKLSAMSVCLIMLLYWVCYAFLRRKY